MADERETAVQPCLNQQRRNTTGRDQAAEENIRVKNDTHDSVALFGPECCPHLTQFILNQLFEFACGHICIACIDVQHRLTQNITIDCLFNKPGQITLPRTAGRQQ